MGDPKRWFAEWTKELSIGREDRAWHEMHTLTDVFNQAGCDDQLNMGALACMELVSRRLQQHTEAYAHGADAVDWARAKLFSAAPPLLTLVPPKMRSCAGRISREEAELEHLRATAKTHAAGASPGVGAAVLVGGLPDCAVGHGDEGKGKKGRCRRPRPSQTTSPLEGGRPPDQLPQKKGRLAASKPRDFSFAVSARTACVVFWWS